MYTNKLIRTFSQLAILSAILGIAACSGDDLTGTPTDTTTTGGGGSTGGGGTTSTVTIGALTATPNTISAGGTSIVSVELLDETGATSTATNTVTFSSPCVTNGLANFDNTTIITSTGTASTRYNATGCTGSDPVTATLGGTTQTASGAVTVAAATAGSIEHTLDDPNFIALSGTGSALGLPEVSQVTFTVKDGLGNPVDGENVTFSLNSTEGGISLSETNVTSAGGGLVSTFVQSGTVSTNVQVTATLDSNTSINAISGTISVATGPPDGNSITLGSTILNPNVWNTNNEIVPIVVTLGDRFNNLVSDGTIVSFSTELGNIEPNCVTVDGSCTVNWISGNPETNNLLINPGEPGITTILAFVKGEESFVDNDSNGIFSDGDGFLAQGYDLEEAFIDANWNGMYDTDEDSKDFNTNGMHDGTNGLYSGIGCIHSTLCDTISDTVDVWASTQMVLAENNPEIFAVWYGNVSQNIAAPLPTFNTRDDSSMSFTIGGTVNGQILPIGSKITFTATNGEIAGGGTHIVGNSVATADTYTVFINGDGTSGGTGSLVLKVEIKDINGAISNTVTYPPITIDDRTEHTIGGTIAGIPASESVVIQSNGGDDITISADGGFFFNTKIIDQDPYNVTISTQPASAICTVTNGSGIVEADNVIDVIIDCI